MIPSIKKKRFSKKNKAAWRKHADTKDVDEFLEEQRQSERIGNFSDKKDEELFVVDVTSCPKLLISAKERRKRNALKTAKSFVALENTSAVQDPITKRNKVKQKKNGRNILEEVINPTSEKHIQANKDRSKYNAKLEKKVANLKKRSFKEDIWEDDKMELKEFTNQEWVSKTLALYHLKNTGRSLIKAPSSIRKKTTAINSVEKPHPGMSYNPSLVDHHKLIAKVISKEEEKIKEEKHLRRVTTNMFSKVTEAERDLEKLKELQSGMNDDQENLHENNDAHKNEYKPLNPPVVVKKKDRKSRRKQKEQKEIKLAKNEKKLQKKKIADIDNLKKLNDKIVIEEKEKNELKKRKKLTMKKKKYQPKRLGKLKFQEPDIDFNEPEDLAGNLRNVKTESSLLVDRFKIFQKRNLLPVSVDVGVQKRRKVKRFVRSSHKEIPTKPIKTNIKNIDKEFINISNI